MNGYLHPKPHIHVKNPLSRNISTRLRMYKVLLFKFRRHICKGLQSQLKCLNIESDILNEEGLVSKQAEVLASVVDC